MKRILESIGVGMGISLSSVCFTVGFISVLYTATTGSLMPLDIPFILMILVLNAVFSGLMNYSFKYD